MGALSFAGWIHLIFFGAVVPAVVLRTRRKIDTGFELPPFDRHIASAMVQLVVFGALSLLVAFIEHIELFPARLPPARAWLLGAALYGAAVATMAPQWRRTVERRSRVLRLFMPRSSRDRALWVLASAVAGATEEMTWRGVQFVLLWMLAGDPFVAAGVCAIMFGVAHMVQGPGAVAAIVPFAFAFHLLVYYSDYSLYVAMVVHFAYDVTAGLSYGRLGEELGYFVPRVTESGASAGEPDAAADPGNRS